LKYGCDKPDLRFGLEIQDVTGIFSNSEFKAFKNAVESGSVIRMIAVSNIASRSRKFFDDLEVIARDFGAKGLGSLNFTESGDVKGTLAKGVDEKTRMALREISGAVPGTSLLFLADAPKVASVLLGKIRSKLADILELRQKKSYKFCWITDFPMYERDPDTGQIIFSHNPFSMPQGGMKALTDLDPLSIKAFQYDIVCNGIELSSGAIRNHLPEIMYKAFSIAGYDKDEVDKRFGGMIRAFRFGAPPHGGIAPGVDRIVMLLANEPNLREVISFPMNQNAQDLLMGAPCEVQQKQLDELNIRVVPAKNAK
ncbi:aspartate--tRNA ligase, partial [bacterium]|nr:aspartate--tRNA ligase [bacterium]